MATMQKERLRPLTEAERRELETLVKASSERVDRVQRATALLAVARGETFAAAARAAGYRSPQGVTYLVRRFNRVGLAALEIAAGRGWRPTYDAAARARIVTTAQRPPGRSRPWSGRCVGRGCRASAPRRFGGSCATPAARISGRGPGARPGRRSASARPGWSGWSIRRPRKKGADRPGVQARRGGRPPGLVPGRGRPVPGDPPAGCDLGAGRRAGPPAPRVRARRDRQAADAVPARDRRAPGQGRDERDQCRAPSLAPGRADRRARDAPRRRPRGRARAARPLGHLARPRAARPAAPAPAPLGLGQPGRPPELADRPLAPPPRRHAALYAAERLLAEPGRVDPADHRPTRPRRPPSAVPRRPDHLARRHRRRLGCQPHPVPLAGQAI